MTTLKVGHTKAARQRNAANADAHLARMAEYDALLEAYGRALVAYALEATDDGPSMAHLGVLCTEARADLRLHVQTMSQRIRLRFAARY